MPYICSCKCLLQGYFQCLVGVAVNAPSRGIFSAVYLLLYMLSLGAFLAPIICRCKCIFQRHFLCYLCVAVNDSFRGISSTLYLMQ